MVDLIAIITAHRYAHTWWLLLVFGLIDNGGSLVWVKLIRISEAISKRIPGLVS